MKFVGCSLRSPFVDGETKRCKVIVDEVAQFGEKRRGGGEL